MDLYTTIVRTAGAELPRDRPVDGLDLTAWLGGRGESPRNRLYYFRESRLEAVRDGRWKLRIAPTAELYDLDVDPSERYDRAGDFPEVVSKLRMLFENAARDITPPAR